MGFKTNALARLMRVKANTISLDKTNLVAPNGQYGGDGIGENEPETIDAAFDSGRVAELEEILAKLTAHGLPYALRDASIQCRINPAKAYWLASQTVDIINGMGWKLYLRDDPLKRDVFALKGQKGIVYQRINVHHRIFFTK